MNKLNLKPVGVAIGKVCKAVGYVTMMFAPRIIDAYVENHTSEFVGYNDAIGAILESDMWCSDKPKAVKALKHGEDISYYKTVIGIVNSDMWASDKLKLIQELSED